MRHVAHVRRHVTVPDATLSSWQSDRHASGHRGEVGPESAAGLLERRRSAASPRTRQPGMEDVKHRSDSPSVTHRRHKQDIHAHKSCCRQQVASSAPLHRRQAYVYHSKFDATARPMDKKRCLAPSTNDMPEQAFPAVVSHIASRRRPSRRASPEARWPTTGRLEENRPDAVSCRSKA